MRLVLADETAPESRREIVLSTTTIFLITETEGK
jgi:hypothetical protein